MSVATRGQLLESSCVKDLVGMSNEQLATLKDEYIITTLQDIALLDKADVDSILGTDKNYICHEEEANYGSRLRSERRIINNNDHNSNNHDMKMKATAPIKLSPYNFPTFSGEMADQEHYKTKADVQIS
eukprot:7652499-Ditylum_brightwellii.AAC.2